MSLNPPAAPSVASLLSTAARPWRDHQRSFWMIAGPSTVLLGIIKVAAVSGFMNPSGLSVVVAGTYVVVFDQWFRHVLFDDWKQRSALLAKDTRTRRSTYASWSFIGFCA